MLNLSIILSLFLIFLGGIQCQAPSAVTFVSEFPNWPLNITVTPSITGIFQYRAIISPQFGGGCRGLYSFNCSDCAGTGGTTGATDTSNCPALVNLGFYTSANSAPFTMAITNSSLLPVVAISIKVEAQTAAGYSTNGPQDFTLAAFKSGPVRNVGVNSTNIIFTTPAVENGKVQEYILYVRNNTGDCIFTMTFNCTQCTATPGKKNIAFNTSLCSVKTVLQFLGTESLITSTYTLTEPVINCFNVCIVAVNAYGWGEVACSCIDTILTTLAPTTSPTTPIPTTILTTLAPTTSPTTPIPTTRPTTPTQTTLLGTPPPTTSPVSSKLITTASPVSSKLITTASPVSSKLITTHHTTAPPNSTESSTSSNLTTTENSTSSNLTTTENSTSSNLTTISDKIMILSSLSNIASTMNGFQLSLGNVIFIIFFISKFVI